MRLILTPLEKEINLKSLKEGGHNDRNFIFSPQEPHSEGLKEGTWNGTMNLNGEYCGS